MPGSSDWPRGRWQRCGLTRLTGWSWTSATTSAVTASRSRRWSKASGATRAINRRGRIFGLINDFTASSAAIDSYSLRQTTNALLIGQLVATPITEFGNGRVLRLPHYSVLIEVTTAVVNPAQTRYGIPDIAVAPTLSDWLTGQDPVLAKALDRGRTRVTAVSLPS